MNIKAKIINKMLENRTQIYTKRISNHYIRLTGYNTFLGLIPRLSYSVDLETKTNNLHFQQVAGVVDADAAG